VKVFKDISAKLLSAVCLILSLYSVNLFAQQLPQLSITKVSEHVYSAIGETKASTYENWGHNNNLSFIVSDSSVMVINGGSSYLLAKALHQEIKKITSLPVVWLVNENSQGHSMLGNSYWADLGVVVIAHEDAVSTFAEDGQRSLDRMYNFIKERAEGTKLYVPGHQFSSSKNIQLGNLQVQLLRFGEAHTAGDLSVWLPEQQIIITGDIAFHQRLLAVFPETNTEQWLLSFEKMLALQPKIVVPGHGTPTDVATIKKYTYDYIAYLRSAVALILEQDGDLEAAYAIDQSSYKHLDTFDELAVKNAGRVYQQMEMDSF